MIRTRAIIALVMLSLVSAPPVMAKKKKKDKVVELGGMSIIGNRELPKSLYIVPWKESEVGDDNDLSRSLLDERLNAVDPEEFKRQLDYYEQSQSH
ncbi:MAG: hypothetical protein P8X48_10030 [Acidiferrobacteraceae bacterium]|jgi:hypothetical protein